MYAKTVFMAIIKKENGSEERLDGITKKVGGASSVKRSRNIILGINTNDVLKIVNRRFNEVE